MNGHLRIALLAGLCNALLVIANGFVLLDASVPDEGLRAASYRVYYLVGMGLVGGFPAYLFVRSRLVLPVLIAVGLTALSLGDHVSESMESFTPLYLAAWPFFVGVLATAAALEFGVRWWLVGAPPAPIR